MAFPDNHRPLLKSDGSSGGGGVGGMHKDDIFKHGGQGDPTTLALTSSPPTGPAHQGGVASPGMRGGISMTTPPNAHHHGHMTHLQSSRDMATMSGMTRDMATMSGMTRDMATVSAEQHRLQYVQEFQRMYGAGPYMEGCVY